MSAHIQLYNISPFCHSTSASSFTNQNWPVKEPVPKWNACTLLVCVKPELMLVLTAQTSCDWIFAPVLFKCKYLFCFLNFATNSVPHCGKHTLLFSFPFFISYLLYLFRKGTFIYIYFFFLFTIFCWSFLRLSPLKVSPLSLPVLLFVSSSKADVTSCPQKRQTFPQ